MTLLVVLGVVVVATILAALYLSLKSGRGDEPDPGDAGAGDWPTRGGSRPGRSASLAARVRSMTDRGKAGGPSRRRSGRDDDKDLDVPDYVRARRASRGADGLDRSGLVTAGADQRVAGSRGAADFDDTDPAMQPGNSTAAGYDGYDAAADTRVSAPLGAGSAGYGTESHSTDGYGTEGYGTGDYDARSGRSGYRPGGERGRDSGPPRSRSAGSPRDSSVTDAYSSPDGYGPRRHAAADRPVADRPGGSDRQVPGGRGGSRPAERDLGARDPGTGERGFGPGDRDFGAGEPDFSGGRSAGAPAAYDFDTVPGATAAGDLGAPAASGPHGHARPGGRRRAISPGRASSDPGRFAAHPGGNGPEGYDDAPTPATDSSFSSRPGTGSQEAEGDDRAERRRIAKIQRPNLRMNRSRPDYDNDPWPSADEVDGISDDQYWSDLSSDKPLATTARAAQGAADTDQSWAPGDGAGEPGFASAPVQADSRTAGRDRRARRREAGDDGPEPRPLSPGGGGRRRRDEPATSPRGAEEDPLTSESYSRHARQASDSRSYQGSQEARRPSHGRPDAATHETQAMRADPRGYGAPAPRGARGAGPGGSTPPAGPPGPGGAGGPYEGGGASRRDPYSPYSDGPRPATAYGEGAGGYQPPARGGSRHASPPGGGRPPAPNGPRRARPALPAGGASSPESTSGSGSYPVAPGSGSYYSGAADGAYPGRAGGSYPGSAGGGPSPRTPGGGPSPRTPGGGPSPRTSGGGPSAGNGSPAYPRGGTDPAYPAANGSPAYPGGNGSGAPYPGPAGSSAYPGGAYPGPDGSPAYPGSNGSSAYPEPNGSPAYPGSNGSSAYSEPTGSSDYPRSDGNGAYRGPNGSSGYPGSNASSSYPAPNGNIASPTGSGSGPYPKGDGSPGYPSGNGSPAYPGNGNPAHPGGNRGSSPGGGNPAYPPAGNGSSAYPETYGGPAYPDGPGGSGGRPRGRRSSNRDTRRRDDGSYEDPHRRPDDNRY